MSITLGDAIVGGILISSVNAISILVAVLIHIKTSKLAQRQTELMDRQMALSQRQLIVPLWEQMSTMITLQEGEVKAEWNDVIQTSNTLELIALCIESEAIDTSILMGTLKAIYTERWEQILAYENEIVGKDGKTLRVTGKSLVEYNKAAQRLYEELKKELEKDRKEALNREKPNKLNK